MPLRFFCNQCKQLLKIGSAQAATVIVCPKCGTNIVVPSQSSPKAEELYQFLKRKKAEAESAKQQGSILFRSGQAPTGKGAYYNNLDLYLKDAIRKNNSPADDVNRDDNVPENSESKLEEWIAEFWAANPQEEITETKQPEKSESQNTEREKQKRKDKQQEQPNEPPKMMIPTNELDSAALIVRLQENVRTLRLLIAIGFLLGVSLGYFVHIIQSNQQLRPAQVNQPQGENILIGTLQYRNQNGEKQPDADAVVIFIPKDAKPSSPLESLGLRPGDPPDGERVRQIAELGGKCVRADASGRFEFAYKSDQPYWGLLISAHNKRTEDIPQEVRRSLRVFFRNPTELLGDYNFILEEYDWQSGQYMLRQTL
ncbi:hypothetical protein FACS189454_01460 [Planctomycetales bacterium]|nr:hypothetical protein FACS189454_01460 [Planctomycetales bacterium]